MTASQLDYRPTSLDVRLSDWRTAGFHEEAMLPQPDVRVSVSTAGQLIDAVRSKQPGVIFLHPGLYELTVQLSLVSRMVLRGAGQNVVTLYFPSSLKAIYGNSPDANSVNRYGYASDFAFITSGRNLFSGAGANENVGIEDLTIEFNSSVVASHHQEKGYNAIEWNQSTNSWVRRVRILNADNALRFERCMYCIGEDLIIDAPKRPTAVGSVYGHYAFQLFHGHHNLIRRFEVRKPTWHDCSTEDVTLCVYCDGKGADINFDHHRDNPHHNLYTNINVGRGSRVFYSGGPTSGHGPHSGPGDVYWNIRKGTGAPITLLPPTDPTLWDQRYAIIGHTQSHLNSDPAKRWVEGIWPVEPVNLYLAQRGEVSVPPPSSNKFAIGDRVKATN